MSDGGGTSEEPMDIVVHVIDQNDNKPIFTQDTFLGEVAEASPNGTVGRSPWTLNMSVDGRSLLSQEKRADLTL